MNTTIAAELFPAGEILADELEARGWTQADFSEGLGRPAQFVSEIVSGKRRSRTNPQPRSVRLWAPLRNSG
ncbi:hypothetical protein FRC0024_02417 [Corynebacterium diphtheriae]|nr:hypothetical protein FRC0024_02417 [Corynebacterium diphtheriae]